MTDQTPDTIDGTHYSAVHAGAFEDLHQYTFEHPAFDRPVPGKLFLKELLGLSGMEVSLSKLEPEVSVPFYHKHNRNEELYIFVQGEGRFQVDGDEFDVRPGSSVRVSPGGERTLKNTSSREPLIFVCIQAEEDSLETSTTEDGTIPDKSVVWS